MGKKPWQSQAWKDNAEPPWRDASAAASWQLWHGALGLCFSEGQAPAVRTPSTLRSDESPCSADWPSGCATLGLVTFERFRSGNGRSCRPQARNSEGAHRVEEMRYPHPQASGNKRSEDCSAEALAGADESILFQAPATTRKGSCWNGRGNRRIASSRRRTGKVDATLFWGFLSIIMVPYTPKPYSTY